MHYQFCGATARAVSVGFLALVLSSPALAVTKTWTNNNGSGDGKWNTPSNWSPAGVPTSSDDVEIGVTDQTSNYLIVDTAATANSVTVGNAFTNNPTLEVKSGVTLTIASASTVDAGATLYINNGTVTGAGALTVNGALNWTNGWISGSGALTINGTASLSTTSTKYLDTRTLTNNGIITWSDTGLLYMANGSTLANQASGLIQNTSDTGLYHYTGATPTFTNAGTLRKSTATGVTVISSGIVFSSSGTIDAQSGTIRLDNGGTIAGTLNAASPGTIQFQGGTFNLNTGVNWTGTGTMRMAGGTATIANGVTLALPTLVFDNGTINGTGTLSTGSTGTITWNAGTMDGGGTTLVPNGGTLNMPGSSHKYLGITGSRTLDNSGTINLTGTGYLYMGDAATFTNQPSGLVHITTNVAGGTESCVCHYSGPGSTFNNAGTLRKSGGSSTGTTYLGNSVTFTNSGTVDLQTGTIRFDFGGSNSGTLDGLAGATYYFSNSTFTLNSGTTLSALPTFRMVAGTLTIATGLTAEMPTLIFDGGTINGAGTLSPGTTGTITWNNGTMDGPGTTLIPAGGTLNMPGTGHKYFGMSAARTLDNYGTINVTGTGYLYLSAASTFTNRAGALYEITASYAGNLESCICFYTGASATFTNAGTFRKTGGSSTGYTQIGSGILFTNASTGTIDLESGSIRFENGGTNHGTLDGIAGTKYVFPGGTFTFNTGSTLTTLSTVQVVGATVTIPTGVTVEMPTLSFDAGTINGGGTLSTGATGTITWNNGTMDGGGTTLIPLGGTLNMPGTSSKYVGYTGSRTLDNSGTINLSSTGYLYLSSGATFINQSTGLFHVTASFAGNIEACVCLYTGSGVSFSNAGTFRKSGGTSTGYTPIGNGVAFTNTGTIDLETGTIRFEGGGSNSGTLDAVTGTSYVFPGGTFTFNSGTALTTQGTVRIAGATVTIPTGVTIPMPTLVFDSGTINGPGTLTSGVAGTITWNGGYMEGGGTTLINSDGTLNLPGTTARMLGYNDARTLDNYGTINISGTGYLYLSTGATFTNRPSAFLNFTLANGSTESCVCHYTGATPTFTNAGTLRKLNGTGISYVAGTMTFANTGTIESQSGTMRIETSGTHSGTFTAVTSATLEFANNTHNLDASSTVNGAGLILFSGNTTNIAGTYAVTGETRAAGGTVNMNAAATTSILEITNGTFNANAAVSVTSQFQQTGGVLGGAGTVTVTGLSTHTWSGGTMTGTGNTVFDTGTTLVMPTTSYTYVTGGRTITNNGTISYGTAANPNYYPYLHIYSDGSKIVNNGSFTLIANESIVNNGTFQNASGGTFTKTGGTGTSDLSVVFHNEGTLTATTGTIALTGSGGTHTGPFNVAAGAGLTFGGGATHSVQATSSITSAGTLTNTGGSTVVNGAYNTSGASATRAIGGTITFNTTVSNDLIEITNGTAIFNAATASSRFSMSGGVLAGTGTVTLSGTVNPLVWSGGTMTGTGTTIFDTGTTISMPTTNYTYLTSGRTLDNKGALTYGTNGNVNYYPYLHIYNDGSTFNNNGSVTLIANESFTNGGTFNNNPGATFAKTAGTGTSDLAVTFNNNGSVNVSSGAIALSGGGGTHGGPFSIAAGSTLLFGGYGTHTVQAASSITSNGTLQQSAGTTVVNGTYSTSGSTTTRVTGGTVTFNTPVSNDLIELTNGTGNFNGATTATRFQMSNGTLGGTGTVTVNGTATTHVWSGGSMTGAGATIFESGTTLSMPSTTYTYLTSGRALTLKGATTYGTTSNPNYYPYLHIYNDGSSLTNHGTFTLVGNESITNGGTFTNTGTGTVTKTGGNSSDLQVTFNNAGTTSVSTGTLAFNGGGGTHTGPFNIGAGTTLQFGGYGAHAIQSASSITNTGGTLLLSGGTTVVDAAYNTSGTTKTKITNGTNTFNVAVTTDEIEITSGIANFNAATNTVLLKMSNGTLGGTGTVTATGTATAHIWSGGSMTGAGTTIFETGTTVSMPSTTYTYITGGRTVTNRGSVQYGTTSNPNTYPYLHIYTDGSQFDNEGTFELLGDEAITNGGPFNNSGMFRKNGRTGTSMMAVTVNNSGTVESQTGTLAFNSYNFTQTAGALKLTGGNVSATQPMSFQGGTVGGTGTITATVNNSGAAVIPGGASAAGTLNITGPYTQSSSGTLDIELGGTTAGSGYDQLVVTGAVTLASDLNISTINSFLPASGNTFQILTFGSRPGNTDFANKNGLNLGFGTNLIPAYSATDLQLTTNTVQADISIAMTATPSTVNTGDSFTYNVSVTNNGGSNASGVAFSASLPANVTFVSASPAICTGAPNLTCTIGNLADQATVNVTITVATSAAGSASMTVSVAASQFDPNGANNTANASATVTANADLSVGVTNTLAPVAGATSDYSIVVTNNGPDTANSVTLAITPSAQLTFSSASGACTNGFPCALGNLTIGQSVTINATWSVSPNATGNAQIAASVSAASPTDLDSSDDTSTATNAIAQEADVAVVKAGPSNVPPESGSTVTYSIAVTNNGPSEASAVTLDDSTPNGLTQLSVTGDCATLPCNLGVMSVGQTSNVQVTYSISGAVGTTYTNTATVSSAADSNTSNDSSSVVTTVSNCPATSITAPGAVNGGSAGNVASVTSVAGATYNWSIGNGTITGGQGTSSITFTAGTSGTVSLGVNVTSGSCVSNPSAVVTINPVHADLSVAKSGPANVSPATASTFTYSIDVTNNGPSVANSVTLSDPTPANLTFVSATGACSAFPCSLGTLTNGQTANVQVTYSFTGGSAYAVTNVATVSSANDPNSGNNSASVVTNVAACPTITITAPTSLEPGAAGTATATSVAGATYSWSITNGTITGGQGTNTINLTAGPSGTVSLNVTATVNSCSSNANTAFPITATTLSVTKTGPTSVSPTNASTITYTINVTNGGASAANSVTLSDPTPADLTFVSATGACTAFPCSLGTLNSGQSASVQATYSFSGGPAYSVTNVATVTSSSDPNPHTASITTAISACPTISITAPTALNPGANGAATATAVSGATYNWSITNGTITGGQGTNNITVTAGSVGTTQLGVNVTAGQCTGSATHQITVTSNQADVAITKSAPANVASAASFTYTLTITNNGPANADAVTVSDILPANVTFVSVSSGLCTSGPNVNCSLGTLAAGASQVITIDVTAPQGPATVTNIATVSTTSADPSNSNDSSSATTSVSAPPAQCPPNEPNLVAPENGANNLTSPVTFDWDPVANATLYELWIGEAGDDLTLAATTANTAFTIELSSGSFNWQVIANGAQSCTPKPSAVRSFTVPQIDTCAGNGVATGLSPDGGSFDSPVTLSWNAVPNAIGYIVRYRLGDEALQDAGPMTTATSLTASFPPGAITFVVDTLFSGCPSTRSTEESFTVEQPATCEGVATLTQPANGISISNGMIEFRWTAVSASSGYRVWLQSGMSAPEVLASTLDTTLTKVIPAGTHTWWVETLFPGCPSRESQRWTFTVLPAQNCDDRGRPALLSPSIDFTTSNATVNFSWTTVANAIEYELYLAPVGGVPTLIVTTPSTSATAEVATGHLEWFVRAIFSGCGATESDHRRFTYEPPPNCTANERAVLHAPSEGERIASPMFLDWNDVAGATSYELYVSHGNAEPELVRTTDESDAPNVQRQLGAGRWFVRTRFAQGCAALDSTESRFVVIPQVAACSQLEAPVISAPGQLSSGVVSLLQWSFVPGATSYSFEISTDPDFAAGSTTTNDTGNARQRAVLFTNRGTEPIAKYVRVRAIDTRCNPSNMGPYSSTALVYILPESTSEGSSPIGDANFVEYTLTLGPELAGEPFTATPTASWITVSPSNGSVPPGGRTLTVVVNTAGLPPGTNIGGVAITTGSSGRTGTTGTTVTKPVSISLVSPVTPTPKNTPPPDALVIPAVANADGIGSHFQSDVRVSNTSAQVMKYQLSFIPSGDAGITAGRQTTFSIEPGRTVALDDILKTWFGTGSTNSVGSLEVRPLTEVAKSTSSAAVGALANIVTFASSRTFNITPNGTFGQYIPAIPFANFVDQSKVLSLQQIAHSSQYRTNLGLVEGSGEPANLLVKVFGSTGAKLTEFEVLLKGGQHTQLNGFLSQHGITSLDDGRVEVSVTSGNGKVTAYASVLDNKTADPLLVSPVTLSDSANTRWVVPGVADLNNGAANWQTDMRVFNAGSTAEQLTLSFYSQNGGAPKVTSMTLQPGEVRQLDKILTGTFGVSQNGGAVHVTSADSARLIATARTYNLTTQGTYGQFIAAVTPAEAVGVGSRPLQLLQVEESPRYRSNIGLAEVTGKPVSLEVSIVPPDAKLTATVQVDLAPNEFRQITSMLAGLGMGDVYNARVTVRAVGGEGRATAYASVIDAKTNDPTYVPAQ